MSLKARDRAHDLATDAPRIDPGRAPRWHYVWWLFVPCIAHAVLIFGIQFMTAWYDVECTWYNPASPRTPEMRYTDHEPARPFSTVGIFNMTCEAPFVPGTKNWRLSTKRTPSRIEFAVPHGIDRPVLKLAMLPGLGLLMACVPVFCAIRFLAHRISQAEAKPPAIAIVLALVARAATPFALSLWFFLGAQIIIVIQVMGFVEISELRNLARWMYYCAGAAWLLAALAVPPRIVLSEAARTIFAQRGLALSVLWAATLGGTGLLVLAAADLHL